MDKRMRKSAIVGISFTLVILLMLFSPSFVAWQTRREAAKRRDSTLKFRDEDFNLRTGGSRGGSMTDRTFNLAVLMSKDDAYVLNETTATTVSTYNRRGDPEPLARTAFVTNVAMKIRVSRDNDNEFIGQILSFTGTEHGGREKSKLTRMFQTVDEATRGVEFSFTMDDEGHIETMRTGELRERIISALHRVGQLPFHLEYALSVSGGTYVFPASGASFSPVGRTRVFAPIVAIKTDLCRVSDIASRENDVKSKLLMIDRGGCSFYSKALNAKRFDVAGLIIVDNRDLSKEEEEANFVNTYMRGGPDDGDASETEEIPFVTIIIKKKDGAAIAAMTNGDTSGASVDGEILGGVNAVTALHELRGGQTREELEEEEEEERTTQQQKQHHLALEREDGLHDLLGVSFVVDEMLRTRFSIYPASAISIGSLWTRSMVVTDPTDPSKRALVDEDFKLSHVRRVFEPIHGFGGGRRGDYFGELQTTSREAPVRSPEERRAFWERIRGSYASESGGPLGWGRRGPRPGETRPYPRPPLPTPPPTEEPESSASLKLKQTFTRPGFLGHDYHAEGQLTIHLNTGMVVDGSVRGTSTGFREVALQSRSTGAVKKFLAYVQTESVTRLACTLIPGRGR